MDAARATISKITGRSGHKTDVDEVVNPAVTTETIKPHRHEETTEAVDREVHQDHYHTTVQPVKDREVLPEQHTHNLAPQVNREFRHGDESENQRRVQAELGQFQNTSTTRETTQSTSAGATATGEHVHHHVHETVQPVIHKETLQPEVVHTTIPIHEVHHEKATHHGISALPVKSLDEFKQSGGILSGSERSATHEEYDGKPRPYNEKFATTIDKVIPGSHHEHSSNVTGSNIGSTGNTTRQNYGEDTYGSSGVSSTTGSHTHGATGISSGTGSTGRQGYSDNLGEIGQRDRDTVGNTTSSTGNQYTSSDTSGTQHKKPSLMDKLNPRVDADGDGKPGFMK